MAKRHYLHFLSDEDNRFSYFYTKEKRDRNGNSRYRIYVIDAETGMIDEFVSTCYECQILDIVKRHTGTEV